jgi:hypothetical protein
VSGLSLQWYRRMVRLGDYRIVSLKTARTSPEGNSLTVIVAVSPTTGFRPRGQSAASVVSSKVTLPPLTSSGSVVAWRWPPGSFEPDLVWHARAASMEIVTRSAPPSPAIAPAQPQER